MLEWASSIIAASVITAIAVYIIPDTDNGKQMSASIRFIGALVSLCLIVSPVPKILKSISSFFDADISGETDLTANENKDVSDLIFDEALKEFEKQTFILTEKKLGRNDFTVTVLADKTLTDITVTVIYHSEDFPSDKACSYIQYLYSDQVKAEAVFEGNKTEEKQE